MTADELIPPVARRVPTVHRVHDDERVDDYHWLRDRVDPEVRAYLEAENAYADAVMAGSQDLQEALYQEIVARIQQTDASAPVRHGPWRYYRRTVEGLQYAVHCRRLAGEEADEQILLDENTVAEGHGYCSLGALKVSPDHRLLAYSVDTKGDEVHVLRVRDLEREVDLPDEIPGTGYGVAWASDNRTLFYTTLDETKRPYRCWRHRLGTSPDADILVHSEDDEAFYLSVHRSRSGAFLLITLHSRVTSEVRVLAAGHPEGELRTVEPRRSGVEYFVEHHGERFFILTNEDAPNFRLMETPVVDPGRASWREVLPHRPGVRLEKVDAFADHLVCLERAEGVRRLRVRRLSTGEDHLISQPDAVCDVRVGDNREFDTRTLRFVYTSLVTPRSVYDYDLDRRERRLEKREPVLGGYDPDRYATERLWATAPDRARVPISLVYRVPREGPAPTLLHGYGAYEACTDPNFSPHRISLLDRGVVFAIAHVRGGGELGREWYEQGRLHHKSNSFTDFVACAERLVAEGWTCADRLVIRGGSAGGLLMGAVMNLRPDLFRAVVAEVPFVDVLTTMLDPSLPLTVIEWDEWGNPREPEFYETIKSYSPYDNVAPLRYPDLLVTAGLNDPRVVYWEPAKWVAKLRATMVGEPKVLLKTEMGSGHSGPSGRYDAWREEAFVLAFILDALGIAG